MYKFLFFYFFISSFRAYKLNNTPLFSNNFYKLTFKPNDMLDILTSIKEYTIITDNDNDVLLYNNFTSLHNNVYFVNVNNLLDKKDMLSYLNEKYSNIDTGENLWLFYRGFMLGSRDTIIRCINKYNQSYTF